MKRYTIEIPLGSRFSSPICCVASAVAKMANKGTDPNEWLHVRTHSDEAAAEMWATHGIKPR